MSEFIVHSVPGSPFGRTVLAVLEEKSATYRLQALAPQSLKSSEHLRQHAFGRVPVLEHDDFILYETQAIIRYLDRILPEPRLTPESPRAAARMDQLMNINDWYLFHGVANVIVFQRVIRPMILKEPADVSAIEQAMPRAHQVYNELGRLLGSKPFFAGEAVSLADLALAAQMDFFRGIPEWTPLVGSHRNLQDWLERMNARRSMQLT